MAEKKKLTSTEKYIVRLARSFGEWPCTLCGGWHMKSLDHCPYFGKAREECEDQSKELK